MPPYINTKFILIRGARRVDKLAHLPIMPINILMVFDERFALFSTLFRSKDSIMSVALDRCRFFLIYFLTGILGLAALSAEAKSNAADDSPYIPLDPPFVVNYGSGAGKIKFLKAELSVRADDPATANAVRHHMPLIRNGLILLLSSQTDETI